MTRNEIFVGKWHSKIVTSIPVCPSIVSFFESKWKKKIAGNPKLGLLPFEWMMKCNGCWVCLCVHVSENAHLIPLSFCNLTRKIVRFVLPTNIAFFISMVSHSINEFTTIKINSSNWHVPIKWNNDKNMCAHSRKHAPFRVYSIRTAFVV